MGGSGADSGGDQSLCFVCSGALAGAGESAFPGLAVDRIAFRAAVCSPECAREARSFAARREVQRAPSRAGHAVAALGITTGAVFLTSGRELGRALLVLALFAAGTTRLAYRDAIPLRLARAMGLRQASTLLGWMGIALCLSALVLLGVFALT